MVTNILNRLPYDFKNYKIIQIDGGASKKIFYRLFNNKKSYILTDFISDIKEYKNYIKVYKFLKNINISIPNIIEKNKQELIIISEDFGELRFDKIINKVQTKDLLKFAIDTLIILKNTIKFDINLTIPTYNLHVFEKEIIELPHYYFPHLNIDYNNDELLEDFMLVWKKSFNEINFDFQNFSHKDFNINNLILIPSKLDHLKCGVIDFQNAFWGESCWDLFSLLEDSRILYTDKFNEDFINYFYQKTNQKISLKEFNLKYHFLNCSRQSRLLGRWVKLSKNFNQKFYLDYILVTKERLRKSLILLNNKNLNKFYNKYVLNL